MVRRLCIVLVSVAACAATNVHAAQASSARVTITGGGLTMSNPSATVVSRNPTELDLRTAVTDARGAGSGWFLSLAAASPSVPGSASLVVTSADAACSPDSACTLPVNAIAYPLTASLTGTRTRVFEAAPSSGLGAQSIDLRVMVPATVASTLNFDLSISTPPTAGADIGSTSPPCSIPDLVKTGACPPTP
jgi:hypothetical protein